jgi:hypothetical protein
MNVIRTNSDFASFIDTMRCLGIPVVTMWQLDKENWQDIIDQAGYCITSLACTGMKIGSMVFVFSSGPPHWACKNVNGACEEFEFGPDASFMFAYDLSEKKVVERRLIKFADGSVVGDLKAIDAIASQHHLGKVPRSDSFPGKLTVDGEVYDVSYSDAVVSGYPGNIEGKSFSLELPAFDITLDENNHLKFRGKT